MTSNLLRTLAPPLLTLLSVFGINTSASAETAEPRHTLVSRDGDFEIRDYAAHVYAEVIVTGDRGDPANQGFRPLAGYIFGGNAPKAKIAMTAPVTRQNSGTKIEMTAPVTRQASGKSWKVRFIMPEGSNLATMPTPNDPNVKLYEEPAKRFAVLRFSGVGAPADMARKEGELRALLSARALTPIGEPVYASYNPPWTLPFARRNEVWLELSATSSAR
jgi:hypothetical protein